MDKEVFEMTVSLQKDTVFMGFELLRVLNMVQAVLQIVNFKTAYDEAIDPDEARQIGAVLESIEEFFDRKYNTIEVLDHYHMAKREYELNNN